ncbi:hypothetical protein [Dyadobacter sandarakinus]|uniref:Lipoprotein n=1 Tax=Dyadobacter sandarakinus TaxID=2747268 RepID=A0ABX7I8P5_9BACT|nr:hypothetical protein [Dyadobacter sandarakinus]QRR01842.1 hypothetical protein HWI92_13445 [Dyadobacter sandarakinus]
MKKLSLLLVALFITFLITCKEPQNPEVATLYLNGKDIEGHRREAVSRLYEHYLTSKKDRGYYEVISKHSRFILSFSPSLKLLTVCGDPGSGWGNQFMNVDEGVLARLVSEKITFNDLYSSEDLQSKDSLLVKSKSFINIITNGNP